MKNIKWRSLYFNDEYEVSEYGQIRNVLNNKILSGSLNSSGYRYYYLKTPGSSGKWYFAHRLVILSFIGCSINKKEAEVNHIDGNKLNNHFTNLEWVTHQNNILHSFSLKIRKKPQIPTGPAHWNFGKKLKDETIKKMSESKKGVKHPKFKGYYTFQDKKYTSSIEASQHTGICYRTIIRWAKNNKKGWSFTLIP